MCSTGFGGDPWWAQHEDSSLAEVCVGRWAFTRLSLNLKKTLIPVSQVRFLSDSALCPIVQKQQKSGPKGVLSFPLSLYHQEKLPGVCFLAWGSRWRRAFQWVLIVPVCESREFCMLRLSYIRPSATHLQGWLNSVYLLLWQPAFL